MPWIANRLLLTSRLRLQPGDPLPDWVQRDPGMLRVMRAMWGEGCITRVGAAPSAPAAPPQPPGDAEAARIAEQKEDSWREWVEMQQQLSETPAPEENPE